MIRKLLLLLLLALSAPAAAQQAQTLEGTWALRLEGSIIMRWDLNRDGQAWTGVWVKPDSFASDGRRFGSIRMPAVQRQSDKAKVLGEWVELSFPREGSEDSDTFRFRVLSPTRAEMIYAGTGLPPYTLERVGEGALLGPFDEGKTYGAPRNSAATSSGSRPRPAPSESGDAPRQGPPVIGR